ncbi:MAG TPA: phosphatase PAP2 family protein [Alphaproteobacteria bacterium]|nr:phosphatase PAP2 family protein [Alphaproteobacteria bacterium]
MWFLIALLAVLDAVGLWCTGLRLDHAALLPTLLPILGTGFLAWFYTYIRRDPRIAALTHLISSSLAFTAVTMVLSYLSVTIGRPLVDQQLVAADHALGLDWQAMYAWVAADPKLHLAMKYIYLSLVPQMVFLQLVLNFQGQTNRAWEMQGLFFAISLGCIVGSALWPAAGAFGYFHIDNGEPYVREFAALRAGTLKIIGTGGVQGVIQFPSLHTALALLYIYIVRGHKYMFPVFLVLNLLVIASTPAIGGHHFADLWGGAALALGIIALSRTRFIQRA